MMTITGIWFILFTLFIRLQGKNDNRWLKKALVAVIIAVFLPSMESVGLFLIAATLYLLLEKFIFRNGQRYYIWLLFTILLIVPSLLSFIGPMLAEHANPIHQIGLKIAGHIVLFEALNNFADPRQWLLILAGYLFTIRESTLLIRNVLDNIPAVPRKKESKETEKDEDEYNRGKLIGILERTFIYFLIIFGQYSSIGIILALKSLARFKELNDRNFAEYFLIGSFLSLLFAVLPAVIVNVLINGV